MGERKIGLVLTIALAVVVLVCVSAALLAFDPRTTGADALRTGGLAAGSVVALYALWLNDRRRRVEEQRQQLENRRADLDRDRVADERFARAVELLGHETDQVRVGALHALAGLARSNPDYTQTVLDVLCSYLRRPFAHPRYADDSPVEYAPSTSDGRHSSWTPDARNDAERKLQVRLTAQRLIADLLPRVGDADAPAYDLDLTNATLEYFDLADRKIGTMVLRYAQLFSSNNFSRCEFHGPVWLTGTTVGSGRVYGRFRCEDSVFHERGWFSGVEFHGRTSLDRTRFRGRTRFADSRFIDRVSMVDAVFEGPADFRAVRFDNDVDLNGATFHDAVQHTEVTTAPDRAVTLPTGYRAVTLPTGWRT
ncbi:pentapeptide repeat-containing protein [Saccharopolyspora sp. K220]|uniref:pentapeptide repeat-containing protein n=1 Tax=Saccharopolyspora soli TaxID=2926618 RepID=UPI001F59A5F3|nr:pentapeptide repeat-containing protein [Saccharopolyspora soli]MCI2419657.1 pentapeptide repeat-containing protein [Saccharopolyspora soli]